MESPVIEAHPRLGYVAAGTGSSTFALSTPAVIWKTPRLSWAALLSVVAVHVIVLAVLAFMGAFRLPVVEQQPAALMVEILSPQVQVAPPKPDITPPRPKPVARQERPQPVTPMPVLAAQTPTPALVEESVKVAPPAAPAPPTPVVSATPVSAPRFDANYLDNPAPSYPPLSRRANEEGKVMLRVVVEANGLPSAVNVHTSSGFERLDDAAVNAVRRWKFVPARRGTEAVSAPVLVPIVFSLRN